VDQGLANDCLTSIGFVDNNLHYNQHIFVNQQWKPQNNLENYFEKNQTTSCYSADFDISDYNSTLFEVVLETLFDDDRIHLTEKILRPIAIGQPFILCSTHGSLKFLQQYGFKTFGSVFDEHYDTVVDPYQRLNAIVKLMKQIATWDHDTRNIKMQQIQDIVEHNQQHFFSENFFDQINNELKTNLYSALTQVENINTSKRYIDLRKSLNTTAELRNFMTNTGDRAQLAQAVKQARKYYNQYHNK
jgi:virulence-associated protein VapD